MPFFKDGGFRRRLWLWAALIAVLGLIAFFGDWPVPAFLRQAVLAEVSARLKRPYSADEMRWVPIRGVVFRDALVQTAWPTARAREAWVLGWLPLRPKRFMFVDVEIHGGRDDTGTLHLPWSRAEAGGDLPERIEIRGGEFHWRDERLGWHGVFRRLTAILEPAQHAGSLTALLGDTEPVPVAVAWAGGAGRVTADSVPLRLLPWLPEQLQRVSPPVGLALDWQTRGDSRQYVLVMHPVDAADIRLELDTLQGETSDRTVFTGKIAVAALDLALRGAAGPGTFDLELSPADTAVARVWGKIATRERARQWTSQFALRAAALPGVILDPMLAGMRVRGPVDLEVAGAHPAGPTRISFAARNGRLEGVRGFANFARRTGLARFKAPAYELLRLRAAVGPTRTVVQEALFEGGGLGLSFSGSVSADRVAGRLRALFSGEIVRASPELSRYRPFLDTENGRVRVIFIVSGTREAPRFDPVLPAAPVMLYRGLQQLLVGGVEVGSSAIRQGLSTIFE